MAKKVKPDYKETTEHWFGFRPPDPLPRRISAKRVIKMWKLVYNADVVKISGYKSNRHSPYVLYNVYDEHGNLFLGKVPAHALYEAVREEYNNPDY